jgi:hypothetical protein
LLIGIYQGYASGFRDDELTMKYNLENNSDNPVTADQPQRNISGKVTDLSGAGLPGVTNVVKGNSAGSIINAEGIFF